MRGSSGYGKDYMALDNYKNRLDSVKDLKAGVDYLIHEGYSAPGMLAVKGGSYGGYMTLAAITEYPDLFSAAIDEVGIANYVTFLENTAEYRRALREAEYGPADRQGVPGEHLPHPQGRPHPDPAPGGARRERPAGPGGRGAADRGRHWRPRGARSTP